MRNKTDRNDARGIAQIMRTGWFRIVHVKSGESQELLFLLTNRKTLQRKALDIENEIRGTLKAFGLKVGKVSRRRFGARVLELVADRAVLHRMVAPMLKARAAFKAYVEQMLAPSLIPGDIVRMDKLPSHKVEGCAQGDQGYRRLPDPWGRTCGLKSRQLSAGNLTPTFVFRAKPHTPCANSNKILDMGPA